MKTLMAFWFVVASVAGCSALDDFDDFRGDAGTDLGSDLGTDLGSDLGTDLGSDMGTDQGADMGSDAGCIPLVGRDVPDRDSEDTNCDGIDGDASRSVFVADSGNDDAAGTREAPVRTIGEALERTQLNPALTDVLIATGLYIGAVQLRDGVSLHGGYQADSEWTRVGPSFTVLRSSGPVVTAEDIAAETRVTRLRIEALQANVDGQSSIGALIRDSSGVRLEQVVIDAGRGGRGAPPSPAPARPLRAAAGGNGSDAALGATTLGSQGGTAGASVCGCVHGGRGGPSSSATSSRNGLPGIGSSCLAASSPAMGATGGPGTAGAGAPAVGTFGMAGYTPSIGQAGSAGVLGGGGGGGTGGAATECNNGITAYGATGGGGGAGGCPGTGGIGGSSGGASVGLYLWASTVTLIDVSVSTARGGEGGQGQAGGEGGEGGASGQGGMAGVLMCAGVGTLNLGAANPGFAGGNGGNGGGGGGGSGGPSIGIVLAGGSAESDQSRDVGIIIGAGGPAGAGGLPNGNSGQVGVAQERYVVP